VEEGRRELSRMAGRLVAQARAINSFYLGGLGAADHLPLLCSSHQVGLVPPWVVPHLLLHPAAFTVTSTSVTITAELRDAEARTLALEQAFQDLRSKDVFPGLRGWRDERYAVRPQLSSPPLFSLERAATPLLGLRSYGVHITGSVLHPSLGPCVWLQRRAPSKPTWPNMLDSLVGGGLAAGAGVEETMVKEAMEEAGIPPELAATARPAGAVSFYYQSERGLFPQTEFVYDLELPPTFEPRNTDGEVSGFELVPVARLVEVVTSGGYKTTSAPILADWLVRHGHITVEEEPELPELVELLLLPLHSLFK